MATPAAPPPPKSDFVILREKFKFDHVDPENRSVYREVALRNDGEDEKLEFLIVLDDFLPGLWIEDGEGRELTYLPSHIVEREIGKPAELLKELAGLGVKEGMRILIILLAEPVEAGRTLVVRLHFESEESESDNALFPENWFKVARSKAGQDYDTFFEVRAPPESVIYYDGPHGAPPVAEGEKDPVHVNDLTKFVQVRFPAGFPEMRFRYTLHPLRSERLLHSSIFHALWIVPAAMLALWVAGRLALSGMDVLTLVPGDRPTLLLEPNSMGETVATLGIASVLAIVTFVQPVWVNRAWYLWPLAWNVGLLAASLM